MNMLLNQLQVINELKKNDRPATVYFFEEVLWLETKHVIS